MNKVLEEYFKINPVPTDVEIKGGFIPEDDLEDIYNLEITGSDENENNITVISDELSLEDILNAYADQNDDNNLKNNEFDISSLLMDN